MDAEKAFQKVVVGVHVVTVKAKEKVNGMCAAWVTRVSHQPPLIMVSVGHKRHTHELIKEAGCFCINILAEDQKDYYERFGFSSGRDMNKFEDVEYQQGKTGSPILKDTCGYLDCELVSEHEAGDHTIFVGEVVEAEATDRKPMIFYV